MKAQIQQDVDRGRSPGVPQGPGGVPPPSQVLNESAPRVSPDPRPLPRLLSVPEAARLLGIGRTTAYELIAAGELEVIHIGRSARVPVDAIDEFVDALRSAASQ